MKLVEIITEKQDPAVAKASADKAQKVWATKDFNAKMELAKDFINSMKFKDKIPANLKKLETMTNPNKIDKFIGDIQLKGEGNGVI